MNQATRSFSKSGIHRLACGHGLRRLRTNVRTYSRRGAQAIENIRRRVRLVDLAHRGKGSERQFDLPPGKLLRICLLSAWRFYTAYRFILCRMARAQETLAPAWSLRLASELSANDQTAGYLAANLTDQQLNWQPAPGSWSVGQCLEHLCLMNENYLPAISAALKEKPDSVVEQITPGWLGRWFIRNFAEPSGSRKRVRAPSKIRPAARVDLSVLDRFLSGNKSCRQLILQARSKNVNRIRFWNPFIPGLRFTVGTGLKIIASHQRRHLLQAERVRDSSNFPRG